MRCTSSEEGSGLLCSESTSSEGRRTSNGPDAKASHESRITGPLEGTKYLIHQVVPPFSQGTEHSPVGPGIWPKSGRRIVDRSFQHGHAAVIEGVSQGGWWLDPRQSVPFKGKSLEERGSGPKWMHCAADIMKESGQGQLRGARSPTDGVARLEHQHRAAILRQVDRSRESVWTGPNDDRVEISRLSHSGSVRRY